jgi:adenosine/AMP kinase
LIVFIILGSQSIDLAFAQDDTTLESDYLKTISDLDDLLSTQVTATLTGLSLAGATFLVRTFNDKEDEIQRLTKLAQKQLIKAFVMFLICTISIFFFDFLEILLETPTLSGLILDLVITYGFFVVAIVYLTKSAKVIYKMYSK